LTDNTIIILGGFVTFVAVIFLTFLFSGDTTIDTTININTKKEE